MLLSFLMENANVVLVEDNDHHRELATRFLNLFGSNHRIVAQPNSLTSALDVVEQIKSGALEADVFVLDGNLSPNDTSGEDVRIIVGAIRSAGIVAHTIGYSGSPMDSYAVEVTVDIGKNPAELGNTIDALPELSI